MNIKHWTREQLQLCLQHEQRCLDEWEKLAPASYRKDSRYTQGVRSVVSDVFEIGTELARREKRGTHRR